MFPATRLFEHPCTHLFCTNTHVADCFVCGCVFDSATGVRIAKSIAPSIYGHDNIKMALALALFGGVEKQPTDSHRCAMHARRSLWPHGFWDRQPTAFRVLAANMASRRSVTTTLRCCMACRHM